MNIGPFSPKKSLRKTVFTVWNLFYNNVICSYSNFGIQQKWKAGKYSLLLKTIDENQFACVKEHIGVVNQNLKRTYGKYLQTHLIPRSAFNKAVLIVFDRRDSKLLPIFLQNVENQRFLESQVLDCPEKFILQLIDAIGSCENVRPVVKLFSNQFPVLNLKERGTSPPTCARILVRDATKRREDLHLKLLNQYVVLVHDHGNKKGTFYSATFLVVCKGENRNYCVKALSSFVNKSFQLPLATPLSKKGEVTFAIIKGSTEQIKCFIYYDLSDSAKDMIKVHRLILNSQDNQLLKLCGSTHSYNTTVGHVLIYSFRATKRLKQGDYVTDAYSNYYSVFTTDLYNCFSAINASYEQWLTIVPGLTSCAFVQTRIGKNFPSSRKLLCFILDYNRNLQFRNAVKGDKKSNGKLVKAIGKPEFLLELVVFCSAGSLILESIYFTTQSFGGVNSPILRIKLCQSMVFCKLLKKGFYIREVYDYLYRNEDLNEGKEYYVFEYCLDYVQKVKDFASECIDYISEYFMQWLYDLNFQICLIWDKKYARMLDNCIEGIKNTNPDSLVPFFGFHFSDRIVESFQKYINSEKDICEFPLLYDWYGKMFSPPTNQILAERILGGINKLRVGKPNLSKKMMDVLIFRKHTTLENNDEILNFDNISNVFKKLSEYDKDFLCQSYLASPQGDSFRIERNRTNLDKLFYFNICSSKLEFENEINRVARCFQNRRPRFGFWLDLFKKFKYL